MSLGYRSPTKEFGCDLEFLLTNSNDIGIGYAVAEGFAEAGAAVVLVYASERPEMDGLVSEMSNRHSVPVIHRKCDVSDAQQVETMISGIVE